ncbi:MAG: ATP synthase F0 subunit B [Clostridiaceae bacterium]|jgi:cell division septum initiation protein DivIVA|nr:ATPase [Clostridiales bacterium]MDD2440609.1 ATPase [Eubacteriales bacterium]MDD4138895.1 ATPase [Eubacteriales bacterium]MDD4743030.1 ATPase [Eubacteriales bacterium]NLB43985.1 ATP synthase F0 subunit B [Clostridiaceae bacterium]
MYEQRQGKSPDQSIEDLINRLDHAVATARNVPFSNSCMVDREEMTVLISMIRDNLPAELKQAKWLLEQNRQLIAEARKEAESMIREAESRMAAMIDEHEITQQARQQASQTIDAANNSARQIRNGSIEYARKRLSDLEEQLTGMLVMIQKNLQELR